MPHGEPSLPTSLYEAASVMITARRVIEVYADALERIEKETSDPRAGAHAKTAIEVGRAIVTGASS